MIHLDTNYLIRLLVAGSPQALRVDQWLARRIFGRQRAGVGRVPQRPGTGSAGCAGGIGHWVKGGAI